MVHHDLSNIAAYFEHIIMMNKRLIAQGPVETTLTAAHLSETFGANLLGRPE